MYKLITRLANTQQGSTDTQDHLEGLKAQLTFRQSVDPDSAGSARTVTGLDCKTLQGQITIPTARFTNVKQYQGLQQQLTGARAAAQQVAAQSA